MKTKLFLAQSEREELEDFYEMAVGRELKMKELKEEVNRPREEVMELQNRAKM